MNFFEDFFSSFLNATAEQLFLYKVILAASSVINSLHILEQILKNITPFLFVFLNKFFSLRTIISYYSLYHRKASYTIKIHYFSEFKPILFQFYSNSIWTNSKLVLMNFDFESRIYEIFLEYASCKILWSNLSSLDLLKKSSITGIFQEFCYN